MTPARGVVEKRKRKKKTKSRTQVEISSSESEGDAPQQSKKPTGITAASAPAQQNDDVDMTDAHDAPSPSSSIPSSPAPAPTPAKRNEAQKGPEEFSSIYLRKVTVELADDLDKVRNAQDFKASSLPMLIHALKQGASIYSAEEQRRVVNAAG